MADQTKIEWATSTWSPITGCTPISEGCTNCYAKRMAQRLKGRFGYPEDKPFRVTFHPDKLDEPLKWKKPRHIFVVSMGDLFHEDVPDSWIFEVYQKAFANPQHIFIFLTKRPKRMKSWFYGRECPPHFWFGVTIESQKYISRISDLFWVVGNNRFISHEPLLGPIDYMGILRSSPKRPHIDWVIVGGESGPGARPMHPDWVRSVRDQCQEAEVPFFFKQWGEWLPMNQGIIIAEAGKRTDGKFYLDQHYEKAFSYKLFNGRSVFKVGKKQAGRLLDGREWNERPKCTKFEEER